MQPYVIKFISALSLWLSPYAPFSFNNKSDRHEFTEILLTIDFVVCSLSFSGEVVYKERW